MIDNLFTESELLSGILCKALAHHEPNGGIYQEKNVYGNTVWRERFECTRCLTLRVTPVEIGTGKPIGGRQYLYTKEYDPAITRAQAMATLSKRITK